MSTKPEATSDAKSRTPKAPKPTRAGKTLKPKVLAPKEPKVRSAKVPPGVGVRIHALRKERAWTMDDLAPKAGISPEYISMLEADLRTPSFAVLKSIAKAFGISVSNLLDGVA